jgi:hypothetical protein
VDIVHAEKKENTYHIYEFCNDIYQLILRGVSCKVKDAIVCVVDTDLLVIKAFSGLYVLELVIEFTPNVLILDFKLYRNRVLPLPESP